MWDQAHPVWLGQPTLYTEVRTRGLLSSVNNGPWHSRKLSVLGQVGDLIQFPSKLVECHPFSDADVEIEIRVGMDG